MEPLTILNIIILAIVVICLLKLLTSSVHFLVFTLIAALVLVLYFGVTYLDVVNWVLDALLWVF